MADFVETMQTCNRMCKSHYNCQRCDMHKLREAHERMTCEELLKQHPEEALQVITTWADKNPVPEYPTWAEWLETFGLVTDVIDGRASNFLYDTAAQHIPAEICEKYGIKPKKQTIGE